jgi:hypothetical protein
MTIKQLKSHIAHFERLGLTDESRVLVYSDRHDHADTEVGLMFVEGQRPGSYGIMFAPSKEAAEVEARGEVQGAPGDARAPRPS